MPKLLKALWCYRGFVVSSIRNEFILRFARSRLGAIWMIINPLAQVLIYALILSSVLAAKLPNVSSKYAYGIYLMAGTLAWSLFVEIINRCLNLFIEQGTLMKRVVFPRIALPVIALGSSLLNYLFLLGAILVVFASLGHFLTAAIFWLPLLTLAVMSLASGIGLILGVLNVFVRDIGQVTPIVLQIMFWFTPIVYPAVIVPEQLRYALNFNPMYPIVEGFQNILVYGSAPHLLKITAVMVVAAALLTLGLFMFRKASLEMVDVL